MYRSLFDEARNYILELIRKNIASGERKLPTEREIASRLIASYATVRLVTRQLESEGVILKIRGSGTYITEEAAQIIADQQRRRLFFFHSYVLHEPENDFGVWLIREIEKGARANNWNIRSIEVSGHDEFLRKCRELTSPEDAVVYLPPSEEFSPEHIGALSHFSDRPLVVLDCEMGGVAICNISTDNRRGGMLAARRFLEAGVHDIAIFLSEPPSRQLQSRIQGFCEIAELANIRPAWIDCHIGPDDDRYTFARNVMDEYLKDNPPPAGIFAVSDSGAFGVLESLEAHNIAVGKDVQVIGFDGLAAGRERSLTLASVVQPVTEIVQAVFYSLEHWESIPRISRQIPPVFREGDSLQTPALPDFRFSNQHSPIYENFRRRYAK